MSRDLWLFSSEVVRLIDHDIETGSPYAPIYEAEFKDKQLEEAAKKVNFSLDYKYSATLAISVQVRQMFSNLITILKQF